jgi:hypothetical protein
MVKILRKKKIGKYLVKLGYSEDYEKYGISIYPSSSKAVCWDPLHYSSKISAMAAYKKLNSKVMVQKWIGKFGLSD